MNDNNAENEWSSQTKYLGIVLDEKFKFSKHISHLQKKKNKKIIRLFYPFINTKTQINQVNKLMIYKDIRINI